ncbi:MAG: GNAT family N-acetyltransferase [Rhizobacter sp.]
MTSMSVSFPSARWCWRRFDKLSVHALQHIHTARQQVFVVEQQCPYVDADGCDEHAFHLAAWMPEQPEPVAYARVVDPGFRYSEPSIGRVLTAASVRGRGLGRELLQRAVVQTIDSFPGQGIRISAQKHLEAFYRSFGFRGVGKCYLEDGIPHIEMLRPG